jgi:hypothetical protein
MNKLIFKGPLNSLSFGNVSYNILRELYKRNIAVSLFPVGDQVNLEAYTDSQQNKCADFHKWIQSCAENRFLTSHRDTPSLQLWHLNGSEHSVGNQSNLFTFYELDSPTPTELGITRLHNKCIFSSTYSRDLFTRAGTDNAHAVPIGFDSDFFNTGKTYLKDKVHFGLMGKLEKRKHTAKIIQLWAEKYGDNYDYQLSCCITNPFFQPQQMNQAVGQIMQGKRYGNINFLPYLKTNAEVNEFVNAIDIDLSGLSGGEGWNLPAFNATALGKWSVVLNATSHLDWATESNCLLVEPNGKEEAEDGIFFKKGSPFNQGQIYTFDTEVVSQAMDSAVSKAKSPNPEGEALRESFSYSRTLDGLLDLIQHEG